LGFYGVCGFINTGRDFWKCLAKLIKYNTPPYLAPLGCVLHRYQREMHRSKKYSKKAPFPYWISAFFLFVHEFLYHAVGIPPRFPSLRGVNSLHFIKLPRLQPCQGETKFMHVFRFA
jgi:hypothetical protein